jgi:signal transduction histidine kinase/ligand-binding sensor domain-containing protein/DNA-binding response OmpR family regulator
MHRLSISIIILASGLLNTGFASEPEPENRTNIFSFYNYTQEQGLPHNMIQCIYQDRRGWMWFGTSQGLSRFDGYRFVNFVNNPDDTSSLSGNLVRVITEDSSGNLLVGTENGGLNIFDREKELFLHPYRNHPEFTSREVSVNAIAADNDGSLWIGTDRNLLKIDRTRSLVPVQPEAVNFKPDASGYFVRVMQFDIYGQLWIGTTGGLLIYDPQKNSIEQVNLPLSDAQSKEIYEIFRDDDGSMWIGTYEKGIFIADPVTRKVKPLIITPYHERSETIRSISKSISGDYWLGTRGGLYIYSGTKGVTDYFRHDERDMRSLANNSILDIYHDSNGITWIGTRGGLNMLSNSKQVFQDFRALPSDDHFLNSSTVYALWIDQNGKVWIGTEDGGINIYDPSSGTFKYMMSDEEDPNTISQNCVKAFLDDGKGSLWIGTFWGGIDVLDLKTGSITHYRHSPGDPASLSDNRVWALCHDGEEGIWTGTSSGLDRFDPLTRTFTHYGEVAGNEQVNWIVRDSENDVWLGTPDEIIVYDPDDQMIKRFSEHSRYLMEDSEGRIWVATLDRGIAQYSKTAGAVKYFRELDGLANNQALCILEDNDSSLWISTSNGLSRFVPGNQHFRNFTVNDGLRNNQFSYGAAYKSESGELLFGGISGFISFNPADMSSASPNVPIVFTDLRVFNKSVPVGEGKSPILEKSISETSHLRLKFDQNVFTLEFASLNYINSSSNLYTYYLEGFDRGWNAPSSSRTATYTNLNPGDYTLRIRRVLPGNTLSDEELSLLITVKPPFWMTWWFRTILAVTILMLAYLLFRIILNREKIKNQLAFEKIKARDLHELDMLKLKLFTNISHEIRTPLTLILGPLEKMMAKQIPPEEVQPNLGMVYRNARQLNTLINQLLDFRKLESGNLKLEPVRDDMVAFLSNVTASFEQYAAEKNITLKFHSLKKKLIAMFDPDKVEKILNNLLSNALKFTGEGGIVSVHLSLVFDTNSEDSLGSVPEKQFIEISVKDTGRGIAQNYIDRIFDRFFRVGTESETTGTGIGLALVKELVRLHNGNISVISKPGMGSKFTVKLPFDPGAPAETTEADKERVTPETGTDEGLNCPDEKEEGPVQKIMLIVEDNPDVRMFIKNHFASVYRIVEARNGQEGWELSLSTIPDVIISDILMPDMDGYEFCRRIKKDERTSHIPLLLLTALHSREHEIEGLTSGADDYITKPFDISVLQAKVENMLSVRDALKEKYTKQIILQPTNITISSPDEHFLKKAMEVVEKHISDPDLDIEKFASEAGVSRMQLYRKFAALTNMTTREFIRNIRLKRAGQLLLEKKLSISEVAFAVGFRDLSHFRKCFRQQFGMNATEYVLRNSPVNKN